MNGIGVEELIRVLNLQPHIEGGYFSQSYRSVETMPAAALPVRYQSDRNFGTAIYYLLTPDTFSVMHKLQSDEIYHFYLGDRVEMLLLQPDGHSQLLNLGHDVLSGEQVQLTVPRGWWQGLRVVQGGSFALLGCTVAPGFDYVDFEEGRREPLLKSYPERADLITQLTRR